MFATELIQNDKIIAYYPGIVVSDNGVSTTNDEYVYIPYKKGISYLAPFSKDRSKDKIQFLCA